MPDLPVMLRVRGRRCVVIGGGAVAKRRADALRQAGAVVIVVAPSINQELADLASEVRRKCYEPDDLDGALMVVVATDDPAVNQAVADDAKSKGVIVNRADAPAKGDVTIPAHRHHGPVTIAVHTGGASAAAAATIRQQLSNALDSDWPKLLEIIGAYREKITSGDLPPSRRRDRLLRLTNDDAMTVFKQAGPDGLRRYCDKIVGRTDQLPEIKPGEPTDSRATIVDADETG